MLQKRDTYLISYSSISWHVHNSQSVFSQHTFVKAVCLSIHSFSMSSSPVFLLLLVLSGAALPASSITEKEQQLITKGISAAQNAARAMKALKVLKTVSNFGAVLGPVMSVAGIGAEIAFVLMGVESEEMSVMRREFAAVSTRLDHFSAQFGAVKRKIDWAAVQVAFARHESSVRVLNRHRQRLTMGAEGDTSEADIEAFLTDYEFNFGMAGDRLFLAMSGATGGSPLAHNVFEAARVFTQNHRRQTFEFVRGSVQLLAQAAAVQVAYVTLRYREVNATAFLQNVLLQRMQEVQENAEAVIKAIEAGWKAQAEKDMEEMVVAHAADSHSQFANRAFAVLSEKFEWRRWAVVAYPELSTFGEHAIVACGGGFLFRTGGRNAVWASHDRKERSNFSQPWAWKVINDLQHHWFNKNQALELIQIVDKARGKEKCLQAGLVVIGKKDGETLHYAVDDEEHVYRYPAMVKFCRDPACWFKGEKMFSVLLWG